MRHNTLPRHGDTDLRIMKVCIAKDSNNTLGISIVEAKLTSAVSHNMYINWLQLYIVYMYQSRIYKQNNNYIAQLKRTISAKYMCINRYIYKKNSFGFSVVCVCVCVCVCLCIMLIFSAAFWWRYGDLHQIYGRRWTSSNGRFSLEKTFPFWMSKCVTESIYRIML